MKNMRLTRTKQQVFITPWLAQLLEPWPKGYVRIMRPFLPHEGLKSANAAEIMVVRNDSIEPID